MNTALIQNKEFNDWVCKRTPAGRWGKARGDRAGRGFSGLRRGILRERSRDGDRWGVFGRDVGEKQD